MPYLVLTLLGGPGVLYLAQSALVVSNTVAHSVEVDIPNPSRNPFRTLYSVEGMRLIIATGLTSNLASPQWKKCRCGRVMSSTMKGSVAVLPSTMWVP